MKNNRTKEELARHEAAHFVVAWAVDCPHAGADITPSIRRMCRDGEAEITGLAFSSAGYPSPFEHIIVALAGPIADYWGQDNSRIMDADKAWIDKALDSITEGVPLDADGGDWDDALRQLIRLGYDVTVPVELKEGVNAFLDAARAILKSCEAQWQEAAERLTAHGRIACAPEPDAWPPLSEAELLTSNWATDDDPVPKQIRNCVDECRATAGHPKRAAIERLRETSEA